MSAQQTIARAIAGDEDVREVIALLRLNYDRAVARTTTNVPR